MKKHFSVLPVFTREVVDLNNSFIPDCVEIYNRILSCNPCKYANNLGEILNVWSKPSTLARVTFL
jgi:hypothetical protein